MAPQRVLFYQRSHLRFQVELFAEVGEPLNVEAKGAVYNAPNEYVNKHIVFVLNRHMTANILQSTYF